MSVPASAAISESTDVTDTRAPYRVEVSTDDFASDGSEDGVKTIYAEYEDDAGNTSNCSTASATYTLDTSPPTVNASETGYYSDAALSQEITGGKAAARSNIYTKVVFDELVKYVPGRTVNARPEIKYIITDENDNETETQYQIVGYSTSLSSGRCRPHDTASNTSNTYICRYTVGRNDTGTFKLIVDIATEDMLTHTLEETYTHGGDGILLDSVAPNKPTGLDLESGDDSGDSKIDDITNKTTDLTITGCAETNSTVALYNNNTAIANATATADGAACTNGNNDNASEFSIDIDLTEGVQRITAKATDGSSNTSGSSDTLTITVDTTPPTASLTGAPADTSNVDTLDVTVGGTDVTHYQYADVHRDYL